MADEIHYGSPSSTDSAREIEDDMAALLAEIEDAALADDADTVFLLSDRMTGLLKERDRICKDRR